jgi:hypothetical protein
MSRSCTPLPHAPPWLVAGLLYFLQILGKQVRKRSLRSDPGVLHVTVKPRCVIEGLEPYETTRSLRNVDKIGTLTRMSQAPL